LCSSKIIFAQEITDPKREIYSELADFNCRTMPLDKCECPAAKEMKAYIDALVETGVNKEEIFYKVAKKFTLNAVLDEKVKADVEKRLVKEFGQKRPKISLEFTSFDFGTISKKQGVFKKTIKLHNKGNEPLIIKNIKAACSCTTVALTVGKDKSPYFGSKGAESGWQMVVGPKESGKLEFVLDLASFSFQGVKSKLSRNIFITSNDPLSPEVKVTGTAEVVE
jgi:hypothetical protein